MRSLSPLLLAVGLFVLPRTGTAEEPQAVLDAGLKKSIGDPALFRDAAVRLKFKGTVYAGTANAATFTAEVYNRPAGGTKCVIDFDVDGVPLGFDLVGDRGEGRTIRGDHNDFPPSQYIAI